jgi:hypothetical protein
MVVKGVRYVIHSASEIMIEEPIVIVVRVFGHRGHIGFA